MIRKIIHSVCSLNGVVNNSSVFIQHRNRLIHKFTKEPGLITRLYRSEITMSSVYPALPRLSVRDSFDEDDLSDVDDEVFIRDGKNGGLKLDEDRGVKRPLMAPRRKTKASKINGGQKLPYKALLTPFCYGLLALLVLLGLIIACIYTVNLFPIPLNYLRKLIYGVAEKPLEVSKIVPCTSLASSVLWTRTLPKFTSEAPFRSNDVNGDKIDDIIVGFSTGLDAIDAPENLCDLYFGGQKPCLGGIMALDGKTGSTIWIYWTSHAIFNVDCELDITSDGVKDCLITGRGGILHAVDGSDGSPIWKFESVPRVTSDGEEDSILDVYDATFTSDIDSDDIADVVASHTVQSGALRSSEILVISGKTGSTIRRVDFPGKEELFIAPRPLLHPDGETMLVLVSSTPKKSGGLYVISYGELIHGHLRLHELYWGGGKGILLPPIFTDITSDGTEDIIVATVNATIMAFDGRTFKQIWNYTVPNSEIISIPIPGYYNDDDVPDFMVKHQIGPGYPLYYYTSSTILDGKNGTSLLEKSITDTLGGQMSGLSISVDDFGNDWFLHWSSNCLNHEDSHERYRFLQGQSLLSQSRADLCKLRFNASLVTRLWALSQHVGPPGQSLYRSEDWGAVEYNNSVDPRLEADKYSSDNPSYDDLTHILSEGLPLVSERSSRIEKHHRKTSSFRHKSDDGNNEESTSYYGKQMINPVENSDAINDAAAYDSNPSAENYQLHREPRIFESDGKSVQESWPDSNDWRDKEIKDEKQYDMMYEDNEDPPDNSRINDVREQRSELTGVQNSPINQSQNSKNQYDPNMDYTNGGGGDYVKYYPDSSRESVVPMFNDERADVENKRRKRPGFDNSQPGEENNFRRPYESEEYRNIEKVFKRESMRNDFSTGRKSSEVKYQESRRKKRNDWEDGGKFIKGIQRQPPTGILLPSLTPSSGKTSIDLIFSTYWLPASEVSLILLQRDLDCIKSRRSKKQEFENEDVIGECLAERGVDYKLYQESISRENVRIPLGQMTVYRIKLECVCPEDMLPGQGCKNISQQQSWPAHLGNSANGFFRPFSKRRT